jgi:hypothetical protein
MNASKIAAAVAFLGLATAGGGAHAIGNACRDVTFTVNNNFTQPITVERFELFSASEGRWLNENFADVVVPAGAQGFVVRAGETVEYAENDRIEQIRVSFRRFVDNDPDGPGGWVAGTRIDSSIANPVCVANKRYNATVNP